MIVVDASVATKWFLIEEQTKQARSFLDRHEHELRGPDLLRVEVCRALVAAANARRVGVNEARFAIESWLDRLEHRELPLHVTDDALMMAAVDLALALGHPLKDCIYLALADRLGCPLVTADAKFRDRVADPGRVQLLAEIV